MAYVGEPPGADALFPLDPALADEGDIPLDTDAAMARIEATFDIDPPLSRRHRARDITVRENHLTPDNILKGGDRWVEFYWSNVNLIVPGEKTLIDPRDPEWEDMTENWCTAASNVSGFISMFFKPRQDLSVYNVPMSAEFQAWLSDWRKKGYQEPLGPGDVEGYVVPTQAEIAAHNNQRSLQRVNFQHRMFTDPGVFVHFEILIMWDFNASAPPGEVTWPRVCWENIRFYLDMYELLKVLGHPDRLKCHFMYKDIRQGRYTQTPRSKREIDNDSILGRQWRSIIHRALADYRAHLDLVAIPGSGAGPIDVTQDLIAIKAEKRIRRTWNAHRASNRGQVKFWMCDAFHAPRSLREEDPDIAAWLTRRAQ
ncbi:hypothetical protein D6D03_05082 [Aureobasidium pullulans]|nr:hypothetical protein D6D26_09650 [Aureobasidium pullulans]THY02480.1 hypothetical protein D6D03_05082 [Aureobasidium pullulans]